MSEGQILWEKALAFEHDNWTLRDIITDSENNKWGVYRTNYPTTDDSSGQILYIKLSDGKVRHRQPD